MGNQYIKGQDPHHISGTDKFLCDDGNWKEIQGGSGASALSDLTDVNLVSVTDGQGLVYDETEQKWTNGDTGDIKSITYDYYIEHKSEIEQSDKTYLVTGNRTAPGIAGGGVNCYSTDEQIVGRWTDGKPIYERVYELSSDITLQYDTWVTTPISNDNIEKIVECFALNATGTYWGIISGACDTGDYILVQSVRPGNITVKTIILQYTKTIDTPVSLIPYVYPSSSIKGLVADTGTQQVPFQFIYDQTTQKYGYLDGADAFKPFNEGSGHTYSTTEQVVGTWIDGKPIYEKSYHYTHSATLSAGTTTLFSVGSINLIPNGIQAVLINTSNNRNYPVPWINGTATTILRTDENENLVIVIANDSWGSAYDLLITLQYTKSTD